MLRQLLWRDLIINPNKGATISKHSYYARFSAVPCKNKTENLIFVWHKLLKLCKIFFFNGHMGAKRGRSWWWSDYERGCKSSRPLLSRDFLEKSERSSLCPNQGSNWVLPEYKSEMLPFDSTYSAKNALKLQKVIGE